MTNYSCWTILSGVLAEQNSYLKKFLQDTIPSGQLLLNSCHWTDSSCWTVAIGQTVPAEQLPLDTVPAEQFPLDRQFLLNSCHWTDSSCLDSCHWTDSSCWTVAIGQTVPAGQLPLDRQFLLDSCHWTDSSC